MITHSHSLDLDLNEIIDDRILSRVCLIFWKVLRIDGRKHKFWEGLLTAFIQKRAERRFYFLNTLHTHTHTNTVYADEGRKVILLFKHATHIHAHTHICKHTHAHVYTKDDKGNEEIIVKHFRIKT